MSLTHIPTARRMVAALTCLVLPSALAVQLAGIPAHAAVAPVGQGFTVTAGDLSFILKQIKISERHSATLTASNPVRHPGRSRPRTRSRTGSPPTACAPSTGPATTCSPGRETFAAADQRVPAADHPDLPGRRGPSGGLLRPDDPGSTAASYAQKKGFVFDSQPRVVSNLIVDQTSTNPAAIAAAEFPVRTQNAPACTPARSTPTRCRPRPSPASPAGCVPSHQTLFIPNVTTDVGLSPPYNSMFTFFGQFFDHGVDQTVKGGGTVFVPLKADDPLRTVGPDGKAEHRRRGAGQPGVHGADPGPEPARARRDPR